MNDRLETLLGKMQEALDQVSIYNTGGNHFLCRATLRQAIAELPLIRDAYEREIAELREIITQNEMGET